MTNASKRWAVSAGAVGLVGGLALGATGLASAVSPTPSPPKAHQASGHDQQEHRGQRLRHHGAGGLVTAISDSSLGVRTPRGVQTIALTSDTAFYDGPTKVTRTAIAVGDIVRVRLADPKSSDPVASTVFLVPAHLAGWVTSIDGSKITLTDLRGFTRTVTTSSATKVTKDGADATLAAITVGSFLRAGGKVADDGTTLEAARLGVGLPSKQDRVHAGKRHDGRGGPDDGMDDPPA